MHSTHDRADQLVELLVAVARTLAAIVWDRITLAAGIAVVVVGGPFVIRGLCWVIYGAGLGLDQLQAFLTECGVAAAQLS